MKKILFVSHEYLVGGSTRSLISLIQGINELDKFSIKVLIPFAKGDKNQVKKLLCENHIEFLEIFYRSDFHKIGSKRNFLAKIRREIWDIIITTILYFYIKINKFDAVCSNSIAVDIGARAAMLAKIPHVYYVREFLEEDIGCEFYNKKRMRRLIECSDGIVFVSKALEKKYTSLYNIKKYSQFYNGFITEDYFVKGHDLFGGKMFKIIQVGTLSEGKGTLDTLNMLKKLRDLGFSNIEIEFVGNGNNNYIEKMKEFIVDNDLENSVIISGYSDNIREKLCNKDIVLVNSHLEGFGRVTVEGMLAGCLVIGRNSGGTKEIIIDGENGLLFNNEEEFIDIIRKLTTNITEYKIIARYGQTWALNQYDYRKTARKFLDFMSQVVK